MVRVPTKGKGVAQGSFGLPPEVQKAIDQRAIEKKLNMGSSDEKQEASPMPPPLSEDDGFKVSKVDEDHKEIPVQNQPDPETNSDFERELFNMKDPLKRLEIIGIELSEDDFHQYIFKGYLSKTVPITKGLKKDMTATLKTLTTEEYLMVDKMIADAIDAKRAMTREGLEQLRSVYTLAFGVTQLAGRPIVKPEDKNSLIQTGLAGTDVINALSAGLVTKLIKLHMIFTISMNRLIDAGDSPFLKNT